MPIRQSSMVEYSTDILSHTFGVVDLLNNQNIMENCVIKMETTICKKTLCLSTLPSMSLEAMKLNSHL